VRRRIAVAGAVLGVALLLTGCGSRVSHEAIVAAARGVVSGSTKGGANTPLVSGTGSTSPTQAAAGSAGSTASGVHGSSGAGTAASGATTGGAAATAPGAAGTAAHGSSAASSSTIYLGNVGTYSGVIGAIFTGAQQAIQVWAAYTNAHGGLNGHPVKVVSADDGGDPSTSQTEVQQMVTQDHVIAFVGNLMPLTVQASLPYLQQQHIPVIGGDVTSDYWYQSSVLFPQGTEVLSSVDDVIKAAVAEGKTKLGFLYCEEDPICTNGYQYEITQGHAQQDGADPVYSSSFSLTQPDFTAQCLAAQQAGANVILLGGDGGSLERLARDCSAQNYDPLYEALSIGVSASMQSDSQLNGMLSVQSTFPWMDGDTPAQATYQAALKQYAPSLVGSGASSAEWTSGMLAVAADQDLGATPTSAQFFQGLWTIKNNNLGGLSPPLTFNANGNASVATCYFTITLQNGQFVDPNHGNYQC
jgi:branched-chain amino acid transport system substrate-binding protein